MKPNFGSRRWALVWVIASAMAIALGWFALGPSYSFGPLEKVSIAFPTQPGSALLYVAQERGFFRDQGIEIAGQPVATGRQALDLMLQGKADLSIVADLPLVFAVAKGHKPITIATVFRDHGGVGIVARRDRGIALPGDLRGKRIGVTFGSTSQFFLDAFLMELQIPVNSVTLVDLKLENIAEAIISGQVDAVCTWDPALSKLQDALKEQALTFDTSNQYTFRFQLVASEIYLKDRRDLARKFLAALAQAETYIANQPAEARRLVLRATGMTEAAFRRGYDQGEMGLVLDQGLLLALDDQTRWAIKRGVIQSGPIPNYLDYLHFDALEFVKPQAVTLAH